MNGKGIESGHILGGLDLAVLKDAASLHYIGRSYFNHAVHVSKGKPLSPNTVRAHLRRASVAMGTKGVFATIVVAWGTNLITLDSLLDSKSEDVNRWLETIDDATEKAFRNLFKKAVNARKVMNTPWIGFPDRYAPNFASNMAQLATIVCAYINKKHPELVQKVTNQRSRPLTNRQLDLFNAALRLDYARQNVNSYLATKFELSVNTVNKHLDDAYKRLGAHSFPSAAVTALSQGILSPNLLGDGKLAEVRKAVENLKGNDKDALVRFYQLVQQNTRIALPNELSNRLVPVSGLTGAHTLPQLTLVAYILKNSPSRESAH